jgi:site-specific recombinase XerD
MQALCAQPCENGGENRARAGTRAASSALLAEFTAYLKALKRSPSTLAGYTRSVAVFLAWLDGQDVRGIRRADVQTYQAALVESGKYTTHSVHVLMRGVRRFYDWLDRNGKVLVNPTLGFQLPTLEDRLPRTILTKGEMRRLLDAPDTSRLDGIRDKAMLELFYSAGLRLAELCSLTVYDVDLNGGFVRVNGKGMKDRVVPMGHKAAQYVKEYVRHVRGRFTEKRRDERALFVGKQWGTPINPLIVERLIKRYAEQAGISKRVTPHVFRHTCATHMLADGADVVHVQRLLGHACIDTTQIYTRVAEREVKTTHGKTHPRERDAMPTGRQAEAVPQARPRRVNGPYKKGGTP